MPRTPKGTPKITQRQFNVVYDTEADKDIIAILDALGERFARQQYIKWLIGQDALHPGRARLQLMPKAKRSKKRLKQYNFKLNTDTDRMLLERLDSQPLPRRAYIRSLVMADVERNGGTPTDVKGKRLWFG